MAKVPLPERGQPLDVTYIYQLADAMNTLSTQVSSATYNYTTVDAGTAGPQSIKTSEARMIGGYASVASSTVVSAAQEVAFSYIFAGDFKYAPIVTATPVNISGTPAGQNVSIILTNVSTSRVDGIAKFGVAGDASVGVNLIILGIPN